MSRLNSLLGRDMTVASKRSLQKDENALKQVVGEALEQISTLSACYNKAINLFDNVNAMEDADYSAFIEQANKIQVQALESELNALGITMPALEATSFSVANMISNAKKIALVIWEKIKSWFKTILGYVDDYVASSRAGMKVISLSIANIGNGALKGEYIVKKTAISDSSLSFKVGKLSGNNVYADFKDLTDNFHLYVGEPVIETRDKIARILERLMDKQVNLLGFEDQLLKATSKVLAQFTESAPSGVDQTTIMPKAKFTPNLFAGARLQASEIAAANKMTLTGMKAGYEGKICIAVEYSNSTQQITPLTPREMLNIAGILSSSNNLWINNRDGVLISYFGKELMSGLDEAAKTFPNGESVDLAKRIITTYSSLVLQYSVESSKLYRHAAQTVHAIAQASVEKAK